MVILLIITSDIHVYLYAGAAPGCLLRGGGGGGQNVSLLLRDAKNFAPALKKPLGGGGGLQHIFFRLQKLFNGVRVVSSWPLTAELISKKKNIYI